MIRYDTKPLAKVPTMIGQIAAMQSFWSREAYIAALKELADRGAFLTRVMDMHRLIGCMTTAPVTSYKPVIERRAEIENEIGVSLESCMVRSTIHLREGYGGRGIGSEVDRRGRDHALGLGFTHSLCWGYATEEVFSWLSSQDGATVLSVVDHTDQPFILTPL
jgi:hypothetical protein